MGFSLSKKSGMLFGLAASIVLTAAASAGPAQLQITNDHAWDQNTIGGTGGPFEARPINQGAVEGLGQNGAQAGTYLSFCVEFNEPIGQRTYNAVQNTASINGGVGGGNPDPLDARTAFLFTAFLKGNLATKLADAGLEAFTYGDAASGIALQDAIWVIEEEIDAGDVTSQLATDILALADTAVASGGEWFGKGIGSVRVLNMTDTKDGSAKQDQLILIPLPMTAMLGLVGLIGVGYITRRRMMA